MKTKITIAILLFAALTQSSAAQEKSKMNLRPVGAGLNVQQFHLVGDIIGDIFPANNFLLTINIENIIRIEPEFGIYSSTNEDTKLTDKATQLGMGFYYMFQKESVNMLAGLVVESHSVSHEYLYTNYPYGQTKVTDKTTSLGFGPSLGGEYFFGKHFSFGGRLSLLFAASKDSPGSSASTFKSNSVYTSTGLQARFYF